MLLALPQCQCCPLGDSLFLPFSQHDFSLEKRVLYWVESASWQKTPWCKVTTDVTPTAPPYWLLLVDAEENSHQDTAENRPEEAFPVPRCVSPASNDEVHPVASVNGEQHSKEDEKPKAEGSSTATSAESNRKAPAVPEDNKGPGVLARFFGLPQPKPRTPPVPPIVSSESNCPKPSLVKQSRSLLLFNNVKNELGRAKGKLAALLRPLNHSSTDSSLASKSLPLNQRGRNNKNLRYRSASDASPMGTLKPTPPPTPCGTPPPPASEGLISPVQKQKPPVAVRNLFSSSSPSFSFIYLVLVV